MLGAADVGCWVFGVWCLVFLSQALYENSRCFLSVEGVGLYFAKICSKVQFSRIPQKVLHTESSRDP